MRRSLSSAAPALLLNPVEGFLALITVSYATLLQAVCEPAPVACSPPRFFVQEGPEILDDGELREPPLVCHGFFRVPPQLLDFSWVPLQRGQMFLPEPAEEVPRDVRRDRREGR